MTEELEEMRARAIEREELTIRNLKESCAMIEEAIRIMKETLALAKTESAQHE